MANDIANGLQLVQTLGAGYSGGHIQRCFIPATDSDAMAKGDAVKSAGSADSDGVPTVARVAAGDAIYGVIVGFEEDPDYLNQTHRTASTARYAFVNIDPEALYYIQEDSVGGDLAAADIGLNANLIVAAVDTNTGLSNMELDTSSAATTAALQLKIVAKADGFENNDFGDGNCKFLVKINNHQFGSHTGTAGV